MEKEQKQKLQKKEEEHKKLVATVALNLIQSIL
jgi:hypothetical protein